jgi:hypothetical protein
VKVDLGTINITEEARRALNKRVGKPGLATRKSVRDFFLHEATAALDIIVDEQEEKPEDKRWNT